ncbi:MAG: DUF3488 domain-containing protein [Lachnospiraceae bacterium]|nr:DUF3488 domain-containing protein [Lachnospiraceae bacterium]
MEKENNKFIKAVNKIMPVVMALMILVSLGYLVAGEMILLNDRGVSPKDCTSLDNDFEVELKDGTHENITLPGTYNQVEEGELVLTTVITPQVINEWLMVWNMGHEMNVYIDDELRLTVNNEGRRLFEGNVVYQYDFVDLNEEDEGKTLSIHYPNYANENHQLGSVYIGDKASLILKAICPYQLALVLGFVMVAVGIATIIRVRILSRKDERIYELFYMSLGVTIASAWFLLNSPAAQFVFPNVETAKDCAFFFASMISLPFLMYVGRLFNGRYTIILAILKIMSALSFIILVAGFFFTDLSINSLFIPTEISAVAGLGLTFALITSDIQNRRIKDYYLAAIGIIGFIALALIYVVLFILFPFRGDGGVLLLAGILLCYVSAVLSYRKNSREKDRSGTEVS